MSSITEQVMEMYNKYPYPSPESGREKLEELAYLLKIFSIENNIDLNDKHILDAGTGTGHRLTQAAKAFPNSYFTAVDYCETSLSIAKSLAAEHQLKNVLHKQVNLMEDLQGLGNFDLIMCIGVLHHLECPETGLANLKKTLNEDGALLLWLYGELGGAERMRRKQAVRLLMQGMNNDYESGIQLVKDLKFDQFEFGWNLSNITENELNSLIVDAYLNINEKLYDCDSIANLMKGSGFKAYVISGVTSEEDAFLYDTSLSDKTPLNCKITNVSKFINTDLLKERYNALSMEDKYRLVDLLFRPSGYTVVGLTEGFINSLPEKSRLRNNLIYIK
ncbi:class I SAM-dependent methyltransferase [Pseudoalteromonas piscicida]|uniref:class I SAM-dependent methyltransferase n=1 Tax=Pseudoalteromonas piscicida TaxID=43662 RepID=UPI000E35F3A7|nr:class I SAM-dependent methyltransferase [Pseudoalteromonas piscicida]AXQ99544.1 methyltransferase domain-containing protein [Pseudoalteromonas piscicida]